MSRSTACLEQQRELQQQVIPERQNQRLCPVIPLEPADSLSNEILKFVRTGRLSDELLPLPFAFRGTTFWPLVEPDVWGDRIRVSDDFTRVVKDSLDKYLRPPNWIVSYNPDGKSDSIRLLVISPFEANELPVIPMFRSGALVTQLRMFAARLHETQDLLFYTPELSIPPTSTQQLPYCELFDAELPIFSGTIFFSESELIAYCRFLGLPPPLRIPDQQNAAFDSCDPHNYSVPPTGSLADSSPELYPICDFVQNPGELAKTIIELRFGSTPLACRSNSSKYSIMS